MGKQNQLVAVEAVSRSLVIRRARSRAEMNMCSRAPLIPGPVFQDPQWMPETGQYQTLSILRFLVHVHSYDKDKLSTVRD